MSIKMFQSKRGFTLVELVVIIVILGILAAVAIPKLFSVTQEAEEASVANMVASLESALSMYTARQFLNSGTVSVHNPFDDLSNVPANYKGVNDPITIANTPDGSWSFRTSGNWIMYNPKSSISGGWMNGGQRFIIYQVQVVTDGADTVGIRLDNSAYPFTWN